MMSLTTLVVAALLAASGDTGTGMAEVEETLATLPPSAWDDSVTPLGTNVTHLSPNTTQLSPNITNVESRTTQGEQEVISLASDILFAFDKADISAAGERKITDLVTDVPEGATVQVHGHTDSMGTDERNAELSLERAETVAAVIAEARPDLDLEVEGFGPSRPVEPNEKDGEDNPEGRAKNRRVEIRYED